MKKLIFTLCLAATFTFTSCINILEEMFLNKDGSGTYSITVDMSALMDESMQDMLKSFAQDEDDAEAEEEEIAEEPTETDTVMYFKDMPVEQRGELSRPDFYDKVSMKLQVSDSKELMIMSFIVDFDNAADIDYFLQNMDKMMQAGQNEENPMGGMGGGSDGMLGGLMPAAGVKDYQLFEIGKKMLVRAKAPAPEAEEDESMAMLRMMLAGAEYKTVYHLPGKVKKVSNPDAQIDGKTVTIEGDLIEVMEGKADLSTTVKFKKN